MEKLTITIKPEDLSSELFRNTVLYGMSSLCDPCPIAVKGVEKEDEEIRTAYMKELEECLVYKFLNQKTDKEPEIEESAGEHFYVCPFHNLLLNQKVEIVAESV